MLRVHAEEVRNIWQHNSIGVESAMDMEKTDDEFLEKSKEGSGTFGYKILGIADVEGNLNVRKGASETSSICGKMPGNSACEILGTEGDWTQIESGDVSGFVKSEFLLTGTSAWLRAREIISTYARVETDGLRVRLEPDTEASIYTVVAQGEKLEYVETLDSGWVHVLLDDEDVYVSGEYVKVEKSLDTAVTLSELLYGAGISQTRVNLCEYAKQFVGNRYVFGGASLTKGTDCSGFTMRVYQQFGVSLPHSSRAQANMGTKIKASEAQPGDLFFYGSSGGSINHVALYIGGGQVVHASSPKTGIRISSAYYRTPVKVVRILSQY